MIALLAICSIPAIIAVIAFTLGKLNKTKP